MLETLAPLGFAGWDNLPNPSSEGFDHLFDHNEKSFTKPPQNDIISWGFIVYPGVAQLVARVVWDHQAAGSNPVTRTTKKRQFSRENAVFRNF